MAPTTEPHPISLRVPIALARRVRAFVARRNRARAESDPHSHVRHTFSSVLLEAISVGLAHLEGLETRKVAG